VKVVVKIGGAVLDDGGVLRKCAHAIVELAGDGHQVAVVHGGGGVLTRTLERLGKKSEFVKGLRVTDAETRDMALMVLAGLVNKKLVAAIGAAGKPALLRHIQNTNTPAASVTVPNKMKPQPDVRNM
jgi:acetylglutamate kinase